MPIDVSIIIVNDKTRNMTLDCIESVRHETNKAKYDLIIVDNNSSDGSAAAIAAAGPKARLLPQRQSLGYSRACNLAASQARGRYILLLHPDTVITAAAIDRLVSFAGCMPEARIWGGRSRFANGDLNTASCAARMTPWNQICDVTGLSKMFQNSALFNSEAYGGWRRDSVRRVDIVASNFMLVETRLWRQLNGFDLSFTSDRADADFCLRAEKLGAAPFICPVAEVIHHGGNAQLNRPGQIIKQLVAQSALARKHWPSGTRWLGLALLQTSSVKYLLKAKILNMLNPCHDYNRTVETWAQVVAARKTWRRGHEIKKPTPYWTMNTSMPHHNTVPVLKAG